jgi:DNA-binding MarR family transcriptional regulator
MHMNAKSDDNDSSISGMSAAHFISKDDSLGSLLLNHGIRIRDFILLSFLSDQGSMSVDRLSRVAGIELGDTLEGLKRLSAANLVLREPTAKNDEPKSIARLTGRGEEIAGRIIEQLE